MVTVRLINNHWNNLRGVVADLVITRKFYLAIGYFFSIIYETIHLVGRKLQSPHQDGKLLTSRGARTRGHPPPVPPASDKTSDPSPHPQRGRRCSFKPQSCWFLRRELPVQPGVTSSLAYSLPPQFLATHASAN